MDELRTEFMHTGIRSVAEAQTLIARHPGAWSFIENRVAVSGAPVAGREKLSQEG
jgi:hypothetical protein